MLPKHVSYQARPLPHGRLQNGINALQNKRILLRSSQQSGELFDDEFDCKSAVRYLILLGDLELRVGSVISCRDDEGIVSEPARANLLVRDRPLGDGLDHLRVSPRRQQSYAALESGGPDIQVCHQLEDAVAAERLEHIR